MKKIVVIISVFMVFILTSCNRYTGNYAYFSVDTADYGIDTGYAIAFPKGSSLVAPFNSVLDLMKNDNTLSCLESYWTGGQKDACYEAIDFTNKVYTVTTDGEGESLDILTSSGYEPFEMADANENLTGFDIDLANFIAKELHYTLNWHDGEFEKIVGDLTNDKADLAIAAITPTSERKQSIDFSLEYYFESYTVVMFREDDIFDSIDDLKDKIVSAQSGTVQAQLIETLKEQGLVKDVKLLPYPANAMESLKTNKIDAFFVEQSVADELKETFNK